MHLKKNFPYAVAGYVIAVGLFFSVSSLIEGVLFDPRPPGSHFLTTLSFIFIVVGIYHIFLLSRGKLEKSGKSITEVRQEAIETLKDPALLAQIASEDQNPKICKTAENRLNELNN
jgi:hypothetical protein